MIKDNFLKNCAAPLGGSHGSQGSRGSQFGNHWSIQYIIYIILYTVSEGLAQAPWRGGYTLVKSVEFYYTLSSTLVWSYHSSTEVWSLSIKSVEFFLFHTRCAP